MAPKKAGSEVDHLGLGSETGSVTSTIILFLTAVTEPSHIQREGNRPLFSLKRLAHMWLLFIYFIIINIFFFFTIVTDLYMSQMATGLVTLLLLLLFLISVLFLVLYPTLTKMIIQLR